MALIALTAASGSPGVTTTALGLAVTWPRPVLLVEADPTGGSGILAGYFQGQLAHSGGLIELAMAQRQDRLGAELPHQLVDIPDTQARLLPGSRSHEQAGSLQALWPDLIEALRDLDGTGQDVLVDAGRLGLEGSPRALLQGADLTLLLCRSTLPAVMAATSWAQTLREEITSAGGQLGLLVVGEGHPYSAREVASTLQLPLIATLAWDRRSAAVLSRGRTHHAKRSHLLPSLRAAGEATRAAATADRTTNGSASPLAWLTRPTLLKTSGVAR